MCKELDALKRIDPDARLAALRIKGFEWVDLSDNDSVCEALVAINVRPSALFPQWEDFKAAVKTLRDGH